MDVGSFAEIEQEFSSRVSTIVWCTVATVDRSGRPRSRILHPIWEGNAGWIATGRNSFKAKHITHNPHVSLSYWDQGQKQVYADCTARWEEDAGERLRIWELLKNTPPPMGYDPGLFFQTPENPDYGVLRLTPWRIELWSLTDMVSGNPPLVWRGS